MKYVIFKKNSLFMPVIIPEHINHCDVKIGDARPVSAGFFHLSDKGMLEIDMDKPSESLNLKPDPGDTVLLTAVLCGMTMSFYIDLNELKTS